MSEKKQILMDMAAKFTKCAACETMEECEGLNALMSAIDLAMGLVAIKEKIVPDLKDKAEAAMMDSLNSDSTVN